MTPQQAACFINARNAAVLGALGEVNHWLYRLADFHCTRTEPFKEIEEAADPAIVLRAQQMAELAKTEQQTTPRNQAIAVTILTLENHLSRCPPQEVSGVVAATDTLRGLLSHYNEQT